MEGGNLSPPFLQDSPTMYNTLASSLKVVNVFRYLGRSQDTIEYKTQVCLYGVGIRSGVARIQNG